MRTFVVGPPKCGKSEYAEALLNGTSGQILYVATLPKDEEFHDRIAFHQSRRGSRWRLIEPTEDWDLFVRQIEYESTSGTYLFVDGITMLIWLYCLSGRTTTVWSYQALKSDLLHILKTNKQWVVVDAIPQIKCLHDPKGLPDLVFDLHSAVERCAKSVRRFPFGATRHPGVKAK